MIQKFKIPYVVVRTENTLLMMKIAFNVIFFYAQLVKLMMTNVFKLVEALVKFVQK